MNISVYSEKDDYTRSKINKRYCDKKWRKILKENVKYINFFQLEPLGFIVYIRTIFNNAYHRSAMYMKSEKILLV